MCFIIPQYVVAIRKIVCLSFDRPFFVIFCWFSKCFDQFRVNYGMSSLSAFDFFGFRAQPCNEREMSKAIQIAFRVAAALQCDLTFYLVFIKLKTRLHFRLIRYLWIV